MKVVCIFFGLCILYSCRESEKPVFIRYGPVFNQERKECDLILVDDRMKFTEDIRDRRYLFSYRDDSNAMKRFRWKELLMDTLVNIETERDYYYNQITDEWLIVSSDFKDGGCTYTYQGRPEVIKSVFDGSGTSAVIGKIQFDSTLSKWE